MKTIANISILAVLMLVLASLSGCNDGGSVASCGGKMYAADGAGGTSGNLYTVDPATGAMTTVGPIGYSVTGMAVAPAPSCKIYAVTSTLGSANTQLLTIDRLTGAGTVVGPLTDTAGVITAFYDVAGLTFDSTGTKLYGWMESATDGTTGYSDDLVAIDPATGNTTQIPSSLNTSASGMAVDPSGNLWHFNYNPEGEIIDPATGSVTSTLAITGLTNGNPNSAVFVGATAYVVDSDSAAPATTASLASIDMSTGTATPIGVLTSPVIDALAYAP